MVEPLLEEYREEVRTRAEGEVVWEDIEELIGERASRKDEEEEDHGNSDYYLIDYVVSDPKSEFLHAHLSNSDLIVRFFVLKVGDRLMRIDEYWIARIGIQEEGIQSGCQLKTLEDPSHERPREDEY